VCVCVCVCVLPMAVVPSFSGSVAMLCTSGFIDDVIFRTNFGLCDVDRYFCNE